ncbi:hypothetical protein HPB47_014504 [Ixodes persulcatus]|uniref:Uncharacterized protein n=1 Tax=Ixodes persulcatus TaxID=34615 RepID=A0AC60QXP3_IXOPE|nr:hypothetical protein HPB47_014504 [Ixodes persulcatus]
MGKLEHFKEFEADRAEGWPLYKVRLKFFFTANKVVEELLKLAVLCSVFGPATYAIIRSSCAPVTAVDTPYVDILSHLTAHFMPPPSVIVQQFVFNKRSHWPADTVADISGALRCLSEHCDFRCDLVRQATVPSGVGRPGRRGAASSSCNTNVGLLERRLGCCRFKVCHPVSTTHKGSVACAVDIRVASNSANAQGCVSKQDGTPKPSRKSVTRQCSRCNCDHDATNFGFRNAECDFCKRKTHVVQARRQKEAARNRAKCSDNRRRQSSGKKSGRAMRYGPYHI